jgi:hypothetical protein
MSKKKKSGVRQKVLSDHQKIGSKLVPSLAATVSERRRPMVGKHHSRAALVGSPK